MNATALAERVEELEALLQEGNDIPVSMVETCLLQVEVDSREWSERARYATDAQKPEAKSYFELKSSQGLVWNFPDPGFLEGIKTTTKAIAKCTNITFVRSVGLVGILRETCMLLNFTSPPF